jgi:DNA-binding beta-propeller fold protein YncE
LGGFPVGATLGAGSVWVSDGAGRVLRLDPDTRRVVADIAIGYDASAVAASTDAVWVVGSRRMHDQGLLRIDPRTNGVVARIGSFGGYGAALVAASDAVWFQTDKQVPGPLRRVDPATNRIAGGVATGWLAGMAVHGDRMWTLTQNGRLEWRDSGTGRLLGRLPGFPELPPGGPWKNAIAPDDGGAWIATGRDGAITRVTSDGRVELRAEVGANGPIALAAGSLWITINDGTDRNVAIARVDPATGAVTGRLKLGARLPRALIAVGDELWAPLSDGTVLVVR